MYSYMYYVYTYSKEEEPVEIAVYFVFFPRSGLQQIISLFNNAIPILKAWLLEPMFS